MSESNTKTQKHEGSFFWILVFALVIGAWYLGMFPHLVRGQTPSLTVTGGSGLSIASSGGSTWQQYAVTGSSAGVYNIVWAESNGTTGGIYTATVSLSPVLPFSPSSVAPPPPADTLPIAALTASATASVAGVDAATVAAAATGYETLAKEVDAGAIATPTQLYLSLGVQLLALTDAQRTAVGPLNLAVKGWLNAQQTAGKLDETKMADYARAFHAIARAITPGTVTPAASVKTPSPAAAASPCANGQCPTQEPSRLRRVRVIDR